MTVLYWQTDTSRWLLQPQTTRWRSRYRGPRESWKVNLELDQIGLDISRLYYRSGNDQTLFDQQSFYVEFGVNYDPVGLPYNNSFAYNFTMIYETGLSTFIYSSPYSYNTYWYNSSGALIFTITTGSPYDQPSGYDTGLYDGESPFNLPVNIDGLQGIIRRVQNLRHRVSLLELGGLN